MWERPQRAVGGDLPVPTRWWLVFLPRPVRVLRSPLPELRPGQEAWIWSSSGSISSSRTSASDKETHVDVLIFPIVLASIESQQTDRAKLLSGVLERRPAKWRLALSRQAPCELKR